MGGVFQSYNRPEFPGVIKPYGGSTAPSGYLLCDGAAVSRTTFADLFAAIGTTYGVGDGSTTFNVPNFKGRVPHGKADAGTGAALGDTFGAIDHGHSIPAHFHGLGTGADLAVSASGGHSHFVFKNATASGSDATVASANTIIPYVNFNAVNDFSYDMRGSSEFAPDRAPTTTDTHTHTTANFSGRVGLVTGGVDGNAAMTSGTGNHPALVTQFIIKT